MDVNPAPRLECHLPQKSGGEELGRVLFQKVGAAWATLSIKSHLLYEKVVTLGRKSTERVRKNNVGESGCAPGLTRRHTRSG